MKRVTEGRVRGVSRRKGGGDGGGKGGLGAGMDIMEVIPEEGSKEDLSSLGRRMKADLARRQDQEEKAKQDDEGERQPSRWCLANVAPIPQADILWQVQPRPVWAPNLESDVLFRQVQAIRQWYTSAREWRLVRAHEQVDSFPRQVIAHYDYFLRVILPELIREHQAQSIPVGNKEEVGLEWQDVSLSEPQRREVDWKVLPIGPGDATRRCMTYSVMIHITMVVRKIRLVPVEEEEGERSGEKRRRSSTGRRGPGSCGKRQRVPEGKKEEEEERPEEDSSDEEEQKEEERPEEDSSDQEDDGGDGGDGDDGDEEEESKQYEIIDGVKHRREQYGTVERYVNLPLVSAFPIPVGSSLAPSIRGDTTEGDWFPENLSSLIVNGRQVFIIPTKEVRANVTSVEQVSENLFRAEIRSACNDTKYRSTSNIIAELAVRRVGPQLLCDRLTVTVPWIGKDKKKPYKIPIMALLRFHGVETVEEAMSLIWPHRPAMPEGAEEFLRPGLDRKYEGRSIQDILLELGVHTKAKPEPAAYRRQAQHQLKNEVLPRIGCDMSVHTRLLKLAYLCPIYLRRLIEAAMGLRDDDEPRFEGNKSYQMCNHRLAIMMRQLMSKFMNKEIKRVVRKARGEGRDPDLLKLIEKESLSKKVATHFSRGEMVVSKAASNAMKVVLPLQELNSVCGRVFSERVTTPVQRSNKDMILRQMHPSQLGLLCPVETPEGDNCGLVESVAAFVHVRLGIPTHDLIARVQVLCKDLKADLFPITTKTRLLQDLDHPTAALVLVNTVPVGVCHDPLHLVALLRGARRSGQLPIYASVLVAEDSIEITSDPGIMMTPLFVTSELHRLPKVYHQAEVLGVNLWNYMVQQGVIEYLSAREIEDALIAPTFRHFERQLKDLTSGRLSLVTVPYTHIQVAADQYMGTAASLTPFAKHNQGPRNTYHCAMKKQAMGASGPRGLRGLQKTYNWRNLTPQHPIVQTQNDTARQHGDYPTGMNAFFGIMNHPYAQEDPILIRRGFLDLGAARVLHQREYKAREAQHSGYVTERIGNPLLPLEEEKEVEEEEMAELERLFEIELVILLTRKKMRSLASHFVHAMMTEWGGKNHRLLESWFMQELEALLDGLDHRVITSSINGQKKQTIETHTLTSYMECLRTVLMSATQEMREHFHFSVEEAHTTRKREKKGSKGGTDGRKKGKGKGKSKGAQGDGEDEEKGGSSMDRGVFLALQDRYQDLHVRVEPFLEEVHALVASTLKGKKRGRRSKSRLTFDQKHEEDLRAITRRLHLGVQKGRLGWKNSHDTDTDNDNDTDNDREGRKESLHFEDAMDDDEDEDKEKDMLWKEWKRRQAQARRQWQGQCESSGKVNEEDLSWGDEGMSPGKEEEDELEQKKSYLWLWKRAETLDDPEITDLLSRRHTLKCNLLTNQENRRISVLSMKASNYLKLDSSGIVPVGTPVQNDDVLVGKYIIKSRSSGEKSKDYTREDRSITLQCPPGEVGVVEEVTLTTNADNERFVTVRVGFIRKVKAGDKFCTRHGQKGTVGLIIPDVDMPTVLEGPMAGRPLDIVMSSNNIPSRMTPSVMMESYYSLLGAMFGVHVDGTNFSREEMITMHKEFLEVFPDKVSVMNGITGLPLGKKVAVGFMWYERLKHQVDDKIHSRGRGQRTPLTGQPRDGRHRVGGGGMRVGEMERDSFLAHGASAVIVDRFSVASDARVVPICNKCYHLAEDSNEDLVDILGDLESGKGRGGGGRQTGGRCRICDSRDVSLVQVSQPWVVALHEMRTFGMGIRHVLQPQ